MEPREKSDNPNDPRRYLPIPWGGPIILGQMIITAVLAMLCVGILIGGFRIHNAVEDVTLSLFGYVLAIIGGVGVLAVLFFGTCRLLPDVREYRRRNVRGYRLVLWIAKGSDGAPHLWYSLLWPNDKPFENTSEWVMFVLPLGGWFRRPTVLMPKGRELSRPIRWWQIRLINPLSHLGRIPDGGGQVENPAIAAFKIQLRDRQGDRMTVTVWHALEMLETHGAQILTGPEYGLRNEVGDLRESAGRLTRERDTVQAQLTREGVASEHANRMWRNTLGVIENAIRRIQASSRFGASIEALRIRVFLLERFRNLVPAPRPEEPRLQEWCTWAEAELGTARADLARRERHKARPSARAGA